MAYRHADIQVSRLQLDLANARLGEAQPSQRAAALALAGLHPDELVALAEDIAEDGLDPISISAVVEIPGAPGTYKVLEGNRRLLALKVLEHPALVEAVLPPARRRRLRELAEASDDRPETVRCVVFDSEDEAWPWIELRHTGANSGIGLVSWNANEQDRFRARHGSSDSRTPAGQILDFVEQVSPPTKDDKTRIITTLKRLIATRAVRDVLGFTVEKGVVLSHYPANEIFKSLFAVVDDLRSGRKVVTDLYYETDRLEYVSQLSSNHLPDPSLRLPSPLPLVTLDIATIRVEDAEPTAEESDRPSPRQLRSAQRPSAGQANSDQSDAESKGAPPSTSGSPAGDGRERRSRAKIGPPRLTVIPRTCVIRIKQPRINAIYIELLKLDIDQYANACAVLSRVFIELSVDWYIEKRALMDEETRRNTPLQKRLTTVSTDLLTRSLISRQLERAVVKVAEGSRGSLSASTVTFNQYVHNPYVYPQPVELRSSWDELEPFMLALWKGVS